MATKKRKINFLKVRVLSTRSNADFTNPAEMSGPESGEDLKKNFFKDSDADGIPDYLEEKLGTDPFNPDSDGDRLGDFEEVFVYHTDPNNPDTDGDGISDGESVRAGINPAGPGNLKNFFLPHEGNNYLPRALHPRRLAFYAIGSVAIKFLSIAFIAALPVTAWLTPDVLAEQGKRIIELTNEVRAAAGRQALTENVKLNQAAYDKAQDMLIRQYFSHIGPDNRRLSDWLKSAGYGFSVAGENLAMGFSAASEVVDAWVNSKTHYANIIDPDFIEIGVGLAAGLYEDYETTLVAQYFGAPPAAPVMVANPAARLPGGEVSEPSQASSRSEEAGQQGSSSAVMGDLVITPFPLVAPDILAPAGGVNNKLETIFEIFCPGAEKIRLLDEGKEIYASEDIAAGGYVKFAIKLTEGPHKLTAQSLRGAQTALSGEKNLLIDTAAPSVDFEKSGLIVSAPDGDTAEKVVLATAFLSPDTTRAEVNFNGRSIILKNDLSDTNKWTGSLIIFDEQKNAFNPIIPASITATDQAGNSAVYDLDWENIIPAESTLFDRYTFLKSHQSEGVRQIFNINSILYFILIIIASIALLLNIFVNIKKQHPHVIAKTLGLIGLLLMLLFI